MSRKKEILKVKNVTFSQIPQEEFDRAIFRIFDILLNQKIKTEEQPKNSNQK